jgi:inward rectifier potassium channel
MQVTDDRIDVSGRTAADGRGPGYPAPRMARRPKLTETSLGTSVEKTGVTSRPLTDLYHYLLTSPWWILFLLILAAYLASNALFAACYVLDGGIDNARPGSFRDAYFFSVQTMATIGYGRMVPVSTFSNIVVTLEALFGLVTLALATGLMFAKFSRPRARVIFSRYAVIGMRDGIRSLMVRLANERATGLVEATLRLVILRDEVTAEGESMRRFYTLPLTRGSSAVFALSWTVVHPIDESSPLFGETTESLKKNDVWLVAALVGTEEASGQLVHARHSWTADFVLFDHRFHDILTRSPSGARAMHYERFHDVEPIAPK